MEKTKYLLTANLEAITQNAERIVDTMYEEMLGPKSELTKEAKALFNPVTIDNKDQILRLAKALVAVVKNINNLTPLKEAFNTIVNRHVSLGVKPEDYSAVGYHLINAIENTINPNKDLVGAFKKLYAYLTETLTGQEEMKYDELSWKNTKKLTVIKTHHESEDKRMKSIYLAFPEDLDPPLTIKAGQHISLVVEVSKDVIQTRPYSISNAENSSYLRITVQCERNGAVSNYLHKLKKGDEVEARAPTGDFVLNSKTNRPIVLLSAGSGLAPIVSMLETLINDKSHTQKIFYVHSTQNEGTHAMKKHIEDLHSKHPRLYIHTQYTRLNAASDDSNRINESILRDRLRLAKVDAQNCDYYICGSPSFSEGMIKIISGWVPKDQIHSESFGTASKEQKALADSGSSKPDATLKDAPFKKGNVKEKIQTFNEWETRARKDQIHSEQEPLATSGFFKPVREGRQTFNEWETRAPKDQIHSEQEPLATLGFFKPVREGRQTFEAPAAASFQC